jgi:hypothetical protein
MLLGRSLHFSTVESPGVVLDRLSAVVLPAKAIAPLRPVRVRDWISQHVGKRFVGSVDGSRFKLALLQAPGARFRARGSIVVIVGKVEGLSVDVNLRPPLFVSLLLAAFAVSIGSALALSFFGPMRGHPILFVLALALALPFVAVGWFFNREAALAEQALRQVLFGNGVVLEARNGDA